MGVPFSTLEFLITQPKMVEVEIVDKLWKYHIIPMLPVRVGMGVYVTASQNSGYRPKWWEIKKRRSGKSQHVFKGKGAVDWTCKDFKYHKERFLELIIEHTEYTRMTVYDGFIHCDYKKTLFGDREIFTSGADSKWILLRQV